MSPAEIEQAFPPKERCKMVFFFTRSISLSSKIMGMDMKNLRKIFENKNPPSFTPRGIFYAIRYFIFLYFCDKY